MIQFNLMQYYYLIDGLPWGLNGKESACNAGDPSWIPGSGRFPGEGNGHSTILAWKIPWTEEPGRLQPMGSQRVRYNEQLTLSLYYLIYISKFSSFPNIPQYPVFPVMSFIAFFLH